MRMEKGKGRKRLEEIRGEGKCKEAKVE